MKNAISTVLMFTLIAVFASLGYSILSDLGITGLDTIISNIPDGTK